MRPKCQTLSLSVVRSADRSIGTGSASLPVRRFGASRTFTPGVAGSGATIPGQDAESGLGFTLFTLTTSASASSASPDRTVRALGARHARWIAALVLVVALVPLVSGGRAHADPI